MISMPRAARCSAVFLPKPRLAPVIRAILRVMSISSWDGDEERLLVVLVLLNPAKPEILFGMSE